MSISLHHPIFSKHKGLHFLTLKVQKNSGREIRDIVLGANWAVTLNKSMLLPSPNLAGQDDPSSRADTASLMSASSASVTDTNPSQVQSEAPAKKTKKKKKVSSSKSELKNFSAVIMSGGIGSINISNNLP